MAVAQVLSRARHGLSAPLVHVEAHLGAGLPGFSLVGLPAPVVRESRERVRAAILNSGYEFPASRITVNLAPVELYKEGGRFDLPIALALLLASGQVRAIRTHPFECYGELGLSGELKSVGGLFLAAVHAAGAGTALLLPSPNLAEVCRAGHCNAIGFGALREVCDYLQGGEAPVRSLAGVLPAIEPIKEQSSPFTPIQGQWRAKRALLIAATGGHSLLMVGPPGSGKTLLASQLPALLPALSQAEALEVASIASIAEISFDPERWAQRPYRAPHHSASASAIIGGGPRLLPGEVSLAHRGVLFLDELPEFDRRVLEALREPLEGGAVTLSRANGRLELPAAFQLVAAMNPCPCGYLGDESGSCRCTPRRVAQYRGRLSGPLLDRIDLRVEVPRQLLADMQSRNRDETADPVGLVAAARELQMKRGGGLNCHIPVQRLADDCLLDAAAQRLYERSVDQLQLSGRGMHRLLRISRTIADLAGSERIAAEHLAEAIQLRRPIGGTAI